MNLKFTAGHILTLALLCLLFTVHSAQAEILTLNTLRHYNAAGSLEIVPPPPDGRYSIAYLQKVALSNASRPAFQKEIVLDDTNKGGWFILRIQNYSPEKNWVMRFASGPFGRQGSLNNLGVYDLTQNRLLLNATEKLKSWKITSSPILTINSHDTQTFAIFLTSSPSQNFRGSLTIEPILDKNLDQSEVFNQVMAGVLMALSLCLIIVGFVYNPFGGICSAIALLFPMLYILSNVSTPLYWASPTVFLYEGLWMMMTQFFFFVTILLNTRGGVSSLSHLALLMGQIASVAIVSALTLGNITDDDNLKINLMTLAPLIPMTAAFIITLQDSMYRSSIGRACLASTIIAIVLYTLSLAEGYILGGSWQLSLLPWYGLPLQGLCFIRLSFARGEAIFAERMRLESLKLKEAEQLSRLRLSKEAADQSRLMRVIEREREVMEELRERESQRTEEMRQAKETADEANRAKSAFLAVVSHEIRTPMTGVMGMVRLLLDSSLGGKEREYAQTIKESGDSMLRLLNDILDFSKIERDSLELEEVEFDLNRSLKNLLRLLSGQAQEKGLELIYNIDPALPRYVRGDPARLQQVLLNLMNNAIKFTLSGSVTLNVTKIVADENAYDNETLYVHAIRFEVIDTGIGIDPEAQKSIFSPFAQADTSITRKFGGTGLGLAISKRLIEAMGGNINLQSSPDAGSTFSFTLRMNEGFHDQTLEDEHMRKAYSVAQLDILLVEDNNINQRVIREILERLGHQVTIASNGKEGVMLAQQKAFDIILMDDELPELKGGQATQIIRSREGPNREAPIVGLTGNATAEDKARLVSYGMNAVLGKPLEPQKLNEVLVDLFGYKTDEPPLIDNTQPPVSQETDAVSSIPVLNQAALNELKQVLGEDSLRALVQSLWDKSEEIITDLQKAVETNNSDLLHRKGHEMKGMAGNFGFMVLSHMGAILEKSGKTGSMASVANVVEGMGKQLIEARSVFEDYLKS